MNCSTGGVGGGGVHEEEKGRPVQRARGNGVRGANGAQTMWSMTMLCVQNTDKQNTDNSHRHDVCVKYRQTEHTVLTVILCECRTQTILTVVLCVQNTKRTQTILTVILCVQNTVGRWRRHVHQRCRRLRVVTVAPAQSAVPAQSVTLLPVGQSVLTHHVFSGTRMDRRWHSEGQHTTRQQQTEVSVQSFYCLHRLWAVLSVLPSFFLSSLFPLSLLLLCFVFELFPSSVSCLRPSGFTFRSDVFWTQEKEADWHVALGPVMICTAKKQQQLNNRTTIDYCHKDHC